MCPASRTPPRCAAFSDAADCEGLMAFWVKQDLRKWLENSLKALKAECVLRPLGPPAPCTDTSIARATAQLTSSTCTAPTARRRSR